MNAKISVILPIYNMEPYLSRCLDSIIHNTYRDLEIICVDDGSTDQSLEILERYHSIDSRFVIIHKENGGVSSARNEGLKVATGDFIAFIDPDDWIHPQYFELLMDIYEKYDADVVSCNFQKVEKTVPFSPIDPNAIAVSYFNLEEIFADHNLKSYVWGKLYPAAMIKNKFSFAENLSLAEDCLFNYLVLCSSSKHKIAYIQVPLYCYYQRENSLVHQSKEGALFDIAKLFAEYADRYDDNFYKKNFLTETLKRALAARYGSIINYGKKADIVHEIQFFLSLNLHKFYRLKCASLKDKLIYSVLYYSPSLYRSYRIKEDPTMLIWERNVKASKS